mmetsp:Transcript_8127/g.20835  ORF Transcript_8127/g.20835 Transcript_8127/m.20835 type:complete len:207 (-) Transcript_8127:2482-3102(-)
MNCFSSGAFEASAGRTASAKRAPSLRATNTCSSWQRRSARAASFWARERLCQRRTASKAVQSSRPAPPSTPIRLRSSSHTWGSASKASYLNGPCEALGIGRLPPGSSSTTRRASTHRLEASAALPASGRATVGAASAPQPPSTGAMADVSAPEVADSTAADTKPNPALAMGAPPAAAATVSAEIDTQPSSSGHRSEKITDGLTNAR